MKHNLCDTIFSNDGYANDSAPMPCVMLSSTQCWWWLYEHRFNYCLAVHSLFLWSQVDAQWLPLFLSFVNIHKYMHISVFKYVCLPCLRFYHIWKTFFYFCFVYLTLMLYLSTTAQQVAPSSHSPMEVYLRLPRKWNRRGNMGVRRCVTIALCRSYGELTEYSFVCEP